jgi:hypothetical protein
MCSGERTRYPDPIWAELAFPLRTSFSFGDCPAHGDKYPQ